MAFRSNELGFGPGHGTSCQNEAISDKGVSLGMERNTAKANFHSSFLRKVPFPFLEYKNRVFL
jgi:hypothetical protein